MNPGAETVKIACDTATGITLANTLPVTPTEAPETNGLILTLVTILARIIAEAIINRRLKKKKTE